MAPLLEVDTWPELRDPVLVVNLSGWIDGGMAGAGAVAVLSEQLDARREFGRIDLSDLMDLQQTRPTVHLVDGVSRQITWPSIDFSAGRCGRDVVLCVGPEPSLRWRAVLGEVVEASQRLGVARAFTVAGIPSVASHRRPVQVLATASDAALVSEAGAWRQDYTGPTGAQSALQVMLGQAGIPTVGLWAQVPHYVAAGPSPPAIRALLARLRDLGGVQVDLSVLDDQTRTYVQRVDEGVAERPDVLEAIEEIESESGGDEGRLPSGDELASEIERFLRGQ
ncbi:MAG TPA: PAC2 family protein [Acidimicrobiia bacterium]|jgi:proteasome assembly chaperone (PAC2) family protein